MNRRNFLKLDALFVPVVAAPTVAYSFLWEPARSAFGQDPFDSFSATYDAIMRELSIALRIPEHILRGEGSATSVIARVSASVMCEALEATRNLLLTTGDGA